MYPASHTQDAMFGAATCRVVEWAGQSTHSPAASYEPKGHGTHAQSSPLTRPGRHWQWATVVLP
eukprot:1195173-Rhodomonas_salina.1